MGDAARYPFCDFLVEEMEARGWGDADLAERLPDPVDYVAVQLAIYGRDPRLILDKHTADLLGRVFDVSSEFFLNLAAKEPKGDG